MAVNINKKCSLELRDPVKPMYDLRDPVEPFMTFTSGQVYAT